MDQKRCSTNIYCRKAIQRQRCISLIMKDLVELIVKELVTDKDAVEIVEDRDGGEVNILIKVAEEDKGRVIGVRGNIINSIRTIARSAAIKENVKVNIKI